MTRVTEDDLLLAAEWLDEYEQESDSSDVMFRVATWLRDQAASRRKENAVRSLMRQTGVTRKRALGALAKAATERDKS